MLVGRKELFMVSDSASIHPYVWVSWVRKVGKDVIVDDDMFAGFISTR